MDFITTTLYGLIQGATEFFPVSSSAHLALIPHFMKMEDPGSVFDLFMHVGTALAVIIYFRKKILLLFTEALPDLFQFKKEVGPKVYFLRYFIVTTGVTGILALKFEKLFQFYGRSLLFIGINSIIFAILLYFSHKTTIENKSSLTHKGSYLKAILIGLAQVLALFPGVSRSGITVTTARFLKINPLESTEYSFLLSLPPILIGSLVKALQIGTESLFPPQTTGELSTHYWAISWGLFLSFVIGLLSIHTFLKIMVTQGPKFFCLYRIILGSLCVLVALRT